MEGSEYTIGSGKPGQTTTLLFEELKGIQLGEKPDPGGWITYLQT
jgi:branched-chain amino acid aminotransferase